jgi:ureidoacrylate peracid hydrolase
MQPLFAESLINLASWVQAMQLLCLLMGILFESALTMGKCLLFNPFKGGETMSDTIYTIKPTKSALIIIDAQNEYFSPSGQLFTPNAEKIRQNLVMLRNAAKRAQMLTVFVKHEHRKTGYDVGRMGDFDDLDVFVHGTQSVEIIPELCVSDDDIVIKKTRYSAFVNTELDSILRGNKIDTVLIAGMMTQFCSVTTARHAHDLDYKVIFIPDANSGPDLPDIGYGTISHDDAHKLIVGMLSMGVADIQSTKDIVDNIT